MSLYRKVIWRFVGIAVLPLLILLGLERRQTVHTLESAADTELLFAASTAANLLVQEAVRADSMLGELVALTDSGPSPEWVARFLADDEGPLPEGLVQLSVLPSGGGRPVTRGRAPTDPGCRDGRYVSTVRVTAEGPGESSAAVVYRPALTGGAAGPGTEVWVYDVDGTLLAATSCPPGPGPPSGAAAGTSGPMLVQASADGLDSSVAVAPCPGAPGRWWLRGRSGGPVRPETPC